MARAVPVGLILNEAITNAFKYAFPFSERDTISIRLTESADQNITLVVSDNGRGLPAGFDTAGNNSFGMILMRGMTEDLDGIFDISTEKGTQVSVSFDNSPIVK